MIAAALFGSPGVQAAERAPGLSKERGIPVAWQESIGGQLYSDWPRVLLFRGPFTKHPYGRETPPPSIPKRGDA